MAKVKPITVERRSLFQEIFKFVRENKVLSISVVVTILAAAAVISFMITSRKDVNSKASFAFSQAQKMSDYKTIIQRYPKSSVYVPALFNIGNTLATEGKTNEAIRYYAEIIQKHKDHYLAPRAMCALGYVYQDKGDYKMALKYFNMVNTDYPAAGWGNEASFNIARTHELMGEFDKAEKLYNMILSMSPTTEWANDIKYRLGKIKEAKSKS